MVNYASVGYSSQLAWRGDFMDGEIGSTLKLTGIGFMLGVSAILHVTSGTIRVSPGSSAPLYGEFTAHDAKDIGSTADEDSSNDSRDAIASADLRRSIGVHRLHAIVLNVVGLTLPHERHRPDSRGPPREETSSNPSGRRSLAAMTHFFTLTKTFERRPCS
jgi:hypothetical protein